MKDSLETVLDNIRLLVATTKSGGVYEKGSDNHEITLNAPSQVKAKGCGQRLKKGKRRQQNL